MIVGVDIGATGALALLSPDGALVAVEDMPILHDGPAGRRAVNAALLADVIRRFAAIAAYVEHVGARPGEAASGAFAFGRSRGVVEGVLGSLGIPVTMIAPTVWKRHAGIAPGRENKDSARAAAIARWPAHAALFGRKSDVDRAEAALIAVAGIARKDRS